jgi:lysozyme
MNFPFRHIFLFLTMSCLLGGLSSCKHKSNDVVTKKLPGGYVYRGQVTDGKPDGLGVLSLGDSVVYSGQWSKGVRQGKGSTRDSLGRRIEGTWNADTLMWGHRRDSLGEYVGDFNRQLIATGHGRYRDAASHYYEGLWKNDRREGFGFSSETRYFRVGEWKHDVYKGERLNYTSERIYGIDISKYQHLTFKSYTVRRRRRRIKRVKQIYHPIDWASLRITHLGSLSKKNVQGKVDFKISFIFIKSTEGTTVRNAYFSKDYRAAKQHGYPVGAYHFFSYRTSAAQQASYFLSNTHFASDDLPPVLDLEPTNSQVRAMGGSQGMWQRVRTWLRIVESRTGMRPILYISQRFVNRYLSEAPDIKQKYPVWIARYGEYKPDVKLCVWQLAPDGRVNGIHGAVDINVFNGYKTEFNQWLKTKRYE